MQEYRSIPFRPRKNWGQIGFFITLQNFGLSHKPTSAFTNINVYQSSPWADGFNSTFIPWPETGLQRSSPRLLDFNVIKTKQNYTFLSYSNTLIWSNSSIFSDISSPTLWESSCCLSNMWHIKLWGANASLICNSSGLQRCQRNQTTYFSVRTWKKQISIWLVLISISICLSFMFKRCIAKQIFFPCKQ